MEANFTSIYLLCIKPMTQSDSWISVPNIKPIGNIDYHQPRHLLFIIGTLNRDDQSTKLSDSSRISNYSILTKVPIPPRKIVFTFHAISVIPGNRFAKNCSGSQSPGAPRTGKSARRAAPPRLGARSLWGSARCSGYIMTRGTGRAGGRTCAPVFAVGFNKPVITVPREPAIFLDALGLVHTTTNVNGTRSTDFRLCISYSEPEGFRVLGIILTIGRERVIYAGKLILKRGRFDRGHLFLPSIGVVKVVVFLK